MSLTAYSWWSFDFAASITTEMDVSALPMHEQVTYSTWFSAIPSPYIIVPYYAREGGWCMFETAKEPAQADRRNLMSMVSTDLNCIGGEKVVCINVE